MAKKPHRFAGSGVDIDTRLGQVELVAILTQAAVESTGDLWNGKQRIDESQRGDTWAHYVITNGVARWVQLMAFAVEFRHDSHRIHLATTIGDYTTEQPKALGVVPAGAKKMVALHTYMQFVHYVANTVRVADPSAVIQIREGAEAPQPGSASQPQTTAPTSPSVPHATGAVPTSPVPGVPVPGVQLPGVQQSGVQGVSSVPPQFVPPPVQPQFAPSPAQPQFAPPPGFVTEPALEQFVQPVSVEPLDDELWDAATVVVQRSTGAENSTSPTQGEALVQHRWELVLADGSTVVMSGPVVFGRDPTAAGRKNAQLLKVPEESSGVSKTHAVFDVVGDQLTVTDLHSSNGTAVLTKAGAETTCAPESAVTLTAGDEVELGDYLIAVRPIVAQR